MRRASRLVSATSRTLHASGLGWRYPVFLAATTFLIFARLATTPAQAAMITVFFEENRIRVFWNGEPVLECPGDFPESLRPALVFPEAAHGGRVRRVTVTAPDGVRHWDSDFTARRSGGWMPFQSDWRFGSHGARPRNSGGPAILDSKRTAPVPSIITIETGPLFGGLALVASREDRDPGDGLGVTFSVASNRCRIGQFRNGASVSVAMEETLSRDIDRRLRGAAWLIPAIGLVWIAFSPIGRRWPERTLLWTAAVLLILAVRSQWDVGSISSFAVGSALWADVVLFLPLFVAALTPPVTLLWAAAVKSRAGRRRTRALLLILFIAAGAGAAPYLVWRNVYDRVPLETDDQAYLFQANLYARGMLAYPTEKKIVYGQPWMSYEAPGTGIVGIYPPGRSLLMVPFVWIGRPSWSGPVLGALTLLLLYLSVTAVAGWRTGLLAAGMLGLSAYFWCLQTTYLSQGATMFGCALVLHSLVHLRVSAPPRLRLHLLVASIGGSTAFLARPTVGAILAAAVAGFLLAAWGRRRFLRMLPQLALAAIPAVLTVGLFMLYCRALTGSFFVQPYRMFRYGDILRLGFGFLDHTLARGVTYAASNLFRWNWGGVLWVPVAGVLAGAGLVGRRGRPVAAFCIVSSVLVILLYVHYWFPGIQQVTSVYYAEAVLFMTVPLALGLRRLLLWTRDSLRDPDRLRWGVVCFLLLPFAAHTALGTIVNFETIREGARAMSAPFREIRRRDIHDSAVLITGAGINSPDFYSLVPFEADPAGNIRASRDFRALVRNEAGRRPFWHYHLSDGVNDGLRPLPGSFVVAPRDVFDATVPLAWRPPRNWDEICLDIGEPVSETRFSWEAEASPPRVHVADSAHSDRTVVETIREVSGDETFLVEAGDTAEGKGVPDHLLVARFPGPASRELLITVNGETGIPWKVSHGEDRWFETAAVIPGEFLRTGSNRLTLSSDPDVGPRSSARYWFFPAPRP